MLCSIQVMNFVLPQGYDVVPYSSVGSGFPLSLLTWHPEEGQGLALSSRHLPLQLQRGPAFSKG